ncbi:MAG: BlaI/MecI/CopY family transcriptional regulator [Gemmatimonadetes bacterium]|nr:BlaI/MecI/CopY family transcriptional regulator [Gemmatimonadota bacterium]
MARTGPGTLTKRESQIMDILYRRKRASVEEIRSELPNAPSASSVRKLLEILMERGHVSRKYDGPRFVYAPAKDVRAASRSALRQLVRTFFDDSPAATFAALLDIADVELSDKEYARLAALLEPAPAVDEEQA